jgi:hypothetical protein
MIPLAMRVAVLGWLEFPDGAGFSQKTARVTILKFDNQAIKASSIFDPSIPLRIESFSPCIAAFPRRTASFQHRLTSTRSIFRHTHSSPPTPESSRHPA